MKLTDLIPDFSAVPGFLKMLSGGITAIPKVFSKNFFKNRYHLHFFISLLFTFLSIRLMCLHMHLEDTPTWFKILIGWGGAYVVNAIREGFLEDRGKAKFDWCDVHAGAYGGIIGTILYIIIN
jgi:hypothetical protein